MDDLERKLAEFKTGFGDGMVPFDAAYLEAVAEGVPLSEATKRGAHAILDAFVIFARATADADLWAAVYDAAGKLVRKIPVNRKTNMEWEFAEPIELEEGQTLWILPPDGPATPTYQRALREAFRD